MFTPYKITRPTGFGDLRTKAAALGLATLLFLALGVRPSQQINFAAKAAQAPKLSTTDFDVIEGHFHDGLGTYAEVTLANELISLSHIKQPPLNVAQSKAINRLPASHPSRAIFQREIANIEAGVKLGAAELLKQAGGARLTGVRHTALEYADAKAADLRLEFSGGAELPVSVKTDKSKKVAVAEGQTPHIDEKWAARYFRVSADDLNKMTSDLGFSSMNELKANYLNVARLVANVLIRKLRLVNCDPTDFSRARVTDLGALKYLLHQLVLFKSGKDKSRVIIFDRSTGQVKWESLLDEVDIDRLTADRVSFLPSRPRGGHPIASEFGVKIDGRTVVSFQIKHKRGSARDTIHRYEFSDITTRLRI
jgi:hypothetical protein